MSLRVGGTRTGLEGFLFSAASPRNPVRDRDLGTHLPLFFMRDTLGDPCLPCLGTLLSMTVRLLVEDHSSTHGTMPLPELCQLSLPPPAPR